MPTEPQFQMPLDQRYRMFQIQFSFSNQNAIPEAIEQKEKEDIRGRLARKITSTGTMVGQIEKNTVSLKDLLQDAQTAGYELTDCFYQERLNPGKFKGTYYMVRFTFCQESFARVPSNQVDIIEAFEEIASSATWKVRVFDNPYYENGDENGLLRYASVSVEARRPLFNPDGTPIQEYPRDEAGRTPGKWPGMEGDPRWAKRPIGPEHELRIQDSTLILNPV